MLPSYTMAMGQLSSILTGIRIMNQEQQQNLGQLHFQKIPLSTKSLIAKKRSFLIIVFGLVFVFDLVMGVLVAGFWKAWPLIGLVELCFVVPTAISLWLYKRWKFNFFLYEYGLVIKVQGVEHLIEFKYYLGEISTGAFKVARANGELFSAQPCQPYSRIHNALVFINLLESMDKLDKREHYQ
jgi:hypothetical protein